MPKLPSNLVKPHLFDNPLRRTTPIDSTVVESVEGGQVIPISSSTANSITASETIVDGLPTATAEASTASPRITVRIDDSIRRALETECFKRRVAGEKTNIAEIARGILASWASST